MTISVTKQEVPEKPQDSEVVLSVQGVSKKFCRDLKKSLFYGVQDITSELLGIREKSETLRKKEFWALKDVSFELRRGEALGLVGKNGSGKSTLLRIIAGLIKPDTGSVEIKGRVAPLIALGAGFNPILTGRENIYANMAILGLSKQEIDERFDAVVDFAEVGEAIDAPVQTYSSGMAARLGFASAIHTEPDILLIDEVLAVGDIRFRAKCNRKLSKLREKGTSFILVSHNSNLILNICRESVYLSSGQVIDSGDTDSIISKYENDLFISKSTINSSTLFLPSKSLSESQGMDFRYLYFRDESENIVECLESGKFYRFCIGCEAHKPIDKLGINFGVREIAGEGDLVLYFSSNEDKSEVNVVNSGIFEIQLELPHLGLKPGTYTSTLSARQEGLFIFDSIDSFKFTVTANNSVSRSLFYQPRKWKLTQNIGVMKHDRD
ncbi:MAG: ABC transporter ATP-binding protein [Xenococcaceae cyanobacterium MO_188.B32]|nr:ABC transporter ATP-binding protein [Xenococcaceae cyanobacterium MO_188.B32]